jgi:ClpP class serine protease
VFIVLIDSSFAFLMPSISSGWIQTLDVETGRVQTVSRAALAELADKVRDHQDAVQRAAKDLDLDVVRIGLDQTTADIALSEFVAERRLRKTYN